MRSATRRIVLRFFLACSALAILPTQAAAAPFDLLSFAYGIKGHGLTYSSGYEVTIDETSSSGTELSAFEEDPGHWWFDVKASGGFSDHGGTLYTYAGQDDPGGGTGDVLGMAFGSAKFVSLVSHLELTLFTLGPLAAGVDSQGSVSLYDHTLAKYVFIAPHALSVFWNDLEPFYIPAHVGHVYTLSVGGSGHLLGVEAGVELTGTPVPDGGGISLVVLAMFAVAMARVAQKLTAAEDRT